MGNQWSCFANNDVVVDITHCRRGIGFLCTACNADQFRCDNGQCIPWPKHCDFRPDCLDASDERDCREYKSDYSFAYVVPTHATARRINCHDNYQKYNVRYGALNYQEMLKTGNKKKVNLFKFVRKYCAESFSGVIIFMQKHLWTASCISSSVFRFMIIFNSPNMVEKHKNNTIVICVALLYKCLHDPANVQHKHVYFEYICWKFAGRLLDRVNTP